MLDEVNIRQSEYECDTLAHVECRYVGVDSRRGGERKVAALSVRVPEPRLLLATQLLLEHVQQHLREEELEGGGGGGGGGAYQSQGQQTAFAF